MQTELRWANSVLSSHGLLHSSKWAAEQALGLGATESARNHDCNAVYNVSYSPMRPFLRVEWPGFMICCAHSELPLIHSLPSAPDASRACQRGGCGGGGKVVLRREGIQEGCACTARLQVQQCSLH